MTSTTGGVTGGLGRGASILLHGLRDYPQNWRRVVMLIGGKRISDCYVS